MVTVRWSLPLRCVSSSRQELGVIGKHSRIMPIEMSVQYSPPVVVYRHVSTESVVLVSLQVSVVRELSPDPMVLPLLDLLKTGAVSDHDEGQMQAVAIPIL